MISKRKFGIQTTMRSQSTSLALWAAVGIFFLCQLPLCFAGRISHQVRSTQAEVVKQSSPVQPLLGKTALLYQREQLEGFASGDIFPSPGHQNPAKSPPVHSADHSTSRLSLRDLHALDRRDVLRCDDGPCVDGRYVASAPVFWSHILTFP